MTEKQKISPWIFVAIILLFLIIVAILSWFLIHKMGDVNFSPHITVENWFSFIVTLIGVMITAFVGFQIFSVVEIRRDLKDKEIEIDELKKQTENVINNLRKDNTILTKENNDFKLKILEKQNDITQKVDWDLKEIKKEYWNEIANMKEAVKNTIQTQTDIKTKMNEINEKWGSIQKDQDSFSRKMSDYKHDLANAFLQISKTFGDDNLLKVLTGLKSINLRENFSGENINILIRLIDKLIDILEKNNQTPNIHKENIVQEAHNLQKLSIDSHDKHYFEVKEKIFKIARLAEQLPDYPEKDEKYS